MKKEFPYKRLGKVTSAELYISDRNILTTHIQIDFGGATKVFGGMLLGTIDCDEEHVSGHPGGADWILRVLHFFGVDRIAKIPGAVVYALYDVEPIGCQGSILGLELPPFAGDRQLIMGDWFEDFGKDSAPRERLRAENDSLRRDMALMRKLIANFCSAATQPRAEMPIWRHADLREYVNTAEKYGWAP